MECKNKHKQKGRTQKSKRECDCMATYRLCSTILSSILPKPKSKPRKICNEIFTNLVHKSTGDVEEAQQQLQFDMRLEISEDFFDIPQNFLVQLWADRRATIHPDIWNGQLKDSYAWYSRQIIAHQCNTHHSDLIRVCFEAKRWCWKYFVYLWNFAFLIFAKNLDKNASEKGNFNVSAYCRALQRRSNSKTLEICWWKRKN